MKGRTLVVCEKPTAARRIAQALDDDSTPESFSERGVPYYIARRGREDLIIVSALGHLYTIVQDGGGWTYPTFDFRWVPVHEADKKLARTKNFIGVIEKLALGMGRFVSACDYDMEGSLIGYMVLLNVCGDENLRLAERMRYSTLTDEDLIRSWEEKADSLDFPLIEAGQARHEVDWLFGINLSRALTLSVKNATGFYRALSIGRVQGPTLNSIKEREVEIRTFVPTPFWVIKADARLAGKKHPLEFDKHRLDTREEAKKIESECRGKKGRVTNIRSEEHEQRPSPPFNLGDLQREAYHKLRYSPSTTLRVAERLYLDALISYPRTSSQRLPPSIDVRGILEGLRRRKEYAELAGRLLRKRRLTPRQGKKDDPAHPAIHPTGRLPDRIGKPEGRVFDLICRRFMAAFGEPAVRESVDAVVEVGKYSFHLKGSQILEKGWMTYYTPYVREKESPLPPLSPGQAIPIVGVKAVDRFTKPPPRYNPSSLLKMMEDAMIGTKSTRTDIIDTLFKRGYIGGKNIEMTDLGFTIVETLDRYCPGILSVETTRGLEQDLELIQTGSVSRDAVVEKTVETLKPILSEFKARERLIGIEINEALKREHMRERTLGPCPKCKSGEIKIFTNRKTGKRFAGCSNYFNDRCEVSYPLPQRGKIEPSGKSCPECGAPVIRVIRGKRRPWTLCINAACPAKFEEAK